MKLCDVNNLLIFLVLIILANIAYNIFTNKKNVETFTNGWSLNNQGQLCNNGNCQSIGVLGTGDSGKICTVGSDTLNCNDITTSGDGNGGGGATTTDITTGGAGNGGGATTTDITTDGDGGNVVVSTDSSGSSDGYLSFDKTTSILSSTHEIIEIIFSSWNAEDRPDVTKLIESDYENKWDHSIGVLTPYGADNVTGDLFTFIKGALSSRVVTTESTLEVNILIKASNNTQPHKYYKFIFSLNTDRTIQLTNIIQSSPPSA